MTAVDVQRKRIACELLADVRHLDRQVKSASQAIRTAVRDHGTTLIEVHGVGPVLAAKLLGHAAPAGDHRAPLCGHRPGFAAGTELARFRGGGRPGGPP